MSKDELPDDPEQLREMYEKLTQLHKQVKTLYVPHPKQELFHVAPNKIRAVFGGNRSGKTEMGVNEARMHSTGEYPEWYPETLRWNFPTRGRVIVTDYKKGAGEVLEPKLKQWFGDKIVKIERSMGNISKCYVQHVTGGLSTFDVMTHEQDTMQFEGWSGHWVWCDEPPPRDKYIASLRGLVDFDGRLWITATPISEPWLYDEIILNTARNAWHIAVSIYDNPYLSEKAIKEFEVSLTPEEKEARIHGKFLHLSGRIYKEFDTGVHVIDKLPQGNENWPVYFVMDPADRRRQHGIWAKIDPFGTIYIFDELAKEGTIKETSREILFREKVRYNINPSDVIRIIDPNKGNTPDAVTGLKLKQNYGLNGVYFMETDVNDDIALGHIAVRERLHWDHTKPLDATNHPKLYFVLGTTKECVKQLLSYVWDEWKGSLRAGRAEKEKPKDINKDLPDCIRYLCVYNPHFQYSGIKRTFFDVDTSEYPEVEKWV
jgi:hypothetical protein